jgi:hypothetical protein
MSYSEVDCLPFDPSIRRKYIKRRIKTNIEKRGWRRRKKMEEKDKIKLVDRQQKQKDSCKKITTIDYTRNTQW